MGGEKLGNISTVGWGHVMCWAEEAKEDVRSRDQRGHALDCAHLWDQLGTAPLPLPTLSVGSFGHSKAPPPQPAPLVGSARQDEVSLPQLTPPVGSISHGEAPCL